MTSLEMPLYRKIIDQVATYGPHISLASSGEPFISKDLPDMIRYAGSRGLRTSITTNGLLLNEKKICEVFDAGLFELTISIDSASPGTYEKIRVGGKFEVLMTRLKTLAVLRQRHAWTAQVDIHTVAMKSNIHDLSRIRQVFAPYADVLTVTYPCTYGEPDTSYFPLPAIAPTECAMLGRTMTILSNGDVSICCNNHFGKSVVGNAHTDDLIQLWNSSDYRKLRWLHLEGRFSEIDLCKDCKMTAYRDIEQLAKSYSRMPCGARA